MQHNKVAFHQYKPSLSLFNLSSKFPEKFVLNDYVRTNKGSLELKYVVKATAVVRQRPGFDVDLRCGRDCPGLKSQLWCLL